MNLLKTFRAVVAINLLVIFIQFIFAGQMLSGNSLAAKLHGFTGLLLLALRAIQMAPLIALRVKGMCPGWLVLSNIGVLLAEVVEAVCGHFHILAVHVPLGLAIFGGISRQLYWAAREASSVFEVKA